MKHLFFYFMVVLLMNAKIRISAVNSPDDIPKPNLIKSVELLEVFLLNDEVSIYYIDRALLYFENERYVWFFSVAEPDKGWRFFLADNNSVSPLSGERLNLILIDLNIRPKANAQNKD
ncbi:MAG: hypothetical protein JJU29_04190 [Verrucomicrobia bacterium]|nr:hypothetical protein [Verrucomicrobiota bacterium]MCH8513901.1 hypothetical protein [Kiritimatiellia bacterium]